MCRQPLQLPLQLLDLLLSRPFYAPTPTVRAFHIAAAPASPASEVDAHNSYTCRGYTAAHRRLS